MNPNTSSNQHDLESLLEFEINRINQQEKRPGWTRWAILGALASCVWLLSQEIEKHQTNWGIAWFTFLILFFFNELSGISRVLLSPIGKKSPTRFQFLHSHGFQLRKVSIFLLLRYLLALFVLSQYGTILSRLSNLSGTIYLAIFAVFSLLAFMLSFIRVPFPTVTNRMGPVIVSGLLFLILLIPVIYKFCLHVYMHVFEFDQSDIRVGGLSFIALSLVGLFMKNAAESPLLESLQEIRRGLGLGYLDLNSARQQAELAFSGLKAN